MIQWVEQTATKPTPENATIYGAIIRAVNCNRYALIQGRRSGKWSFPKGHAEAAETPFDCVVREVAEEIGFDQLPTPLQGIPLHVGYYYRFDVAGPFILQPRDLDEVMAAGWFTVEEMRALRVNVDVSWWLSGL